MNLYLATLANGAVLTLKPGIDVSEDNQQLADFLVHHDATGVVEVSKEVYNLMSQPGLTVDDLHRYLNEEAVFADTWSEFVTADGLADDDRDAY